MIKKGFKLLACVIAVLALIQVGRQIFQREEYRARNYVYERVKETFPEAHLRIQADYGLSPYAPDMGTLSDNRSRSSRPGQDAPVVILVHGLDEPGRIWLNLAPALDAEGYRVMFLSYPNDQKIADSARFFFETLRKAVGVHYTDQSPPLPQTSLHIVAHSMGGLVTREMLTDPGIDYNAAVRNRTMPRISTLIMAGTPNHGSELARFRFVMEVRDQVQGLLDSDSGENPKWLRGLLDGTGAAGIDLLPGSEFLTRLNQRPHPPSVRMHVIAGTLSPWSAHDIKTVLEEVGQRLSEVQSETMAMLEDAMSAAADVVGDGLVSLSSARLDGIPLTRVKGTHLTMIRNLTRSSTRVPPAVPVILDILEENRR